MSDPIKHVVVLMMENRSFDHLMGDLDRSIPGLDGIQRARKYLEATGHQNFAKGDPLPFPLSDQAFRSLDAKSLGTKADFDPKHAFPNVLTQLGGNLGQPVMNGFAQDTQNTLASAELPPQVQRTVINQVMAYFPDGALPALHTLAKQFVVCDRWHASVPGPTWANRFFSMAGTAKGFLNMPDDLSSMSTLFRNYDMPTIFNRLHDAKKRSRIYFHDISLSLLLRPTWGITDLRRSFDQFATDVSQTAPDDFPELVWIEPGYFNFTTAGKPNDQHPPHDIGLGDKLIADVYQTLASNAELWKSTLFVVIYDEHGGFFDHVEPDATIAPDGVVRDFNFDFKRLGVRVPAVLASPHLRPGVSHDLYDHTSLLAYICNKWNLAPLGERCAQEMRRKPFAALFEQPRLTGTPAQLPVPRVSKALTRQTEATPPNQNQIALALMVDMLSQELGVTPTLPSVRALGVPPSMDGDKLMQQLSKIETRLGERANATDAWLQSSSAIQDRAPQQGQPLRVWMVHGVGHGDDPKNQAWTADWKMAFTQNAQKAGWTGAIDFRFATYDDLFNDVILDWQTCLRAVEMLIANVVGGDSRSLWDNLQESVRWTAGMTLQWIENSPLRETLTKSLEEQFKAYSPHIVCAHSLGSMACYDMFRQIVQRGDAKQLNGVGLFTFGSQLANPVVSSAVGGKIMPLYDANGDGIAQWYQLYNPNDAVFTELMRLNDARTHALTQAFFALPLHHDGARYLEQSKVAEEILPRLLPIPRTARLEAAASFMIRPSAVRARRRALLVGINQYPKQDMRLNGCVNDVYLMSAVLQESGFAADDIRLLTDERATRAALLERLDWLSAGAQAGDERVFFFSGHGAQLPNYQADGTPGRMDEALAPVDFDWSPEHAFTDKEFVKFYSQLSYDVSFTAILDCCYAGGMYRGTHRVRGIDPPDDIRHRTLRWDSTHQMWVPRDYVEQAANTGPAFAPKTGAADVSDAVKKRSLGLGEAKLLWSNSETAFDQAKSRYGHFGPYVPTLVSAAGDSQLAAEYDHGAIAYGAFTFCLVKQLRSLRRPTSFRRLVQGVSRELRTLGYTQAPSVSGPSSKLDKVGLPFGHWKYR
ncbi:MAG: caspase family protein [Pseudomonadales bacterium]|jgi:phospholipase C|nr:caspase family protein [Pseudomonadales bacterium]